MKIKTSNVYQEAEKAFYQKKNVLKFFFDLYL
jgi:hypothetical protein